MRSDIALAYDPVNRRADLVFTGTDFALDTTWQTPVMMCMGLDRRARPDDEIPMTVISLPPDAPLANWRRGSTLDYLDPYGELQGSRLWTLARSKLDEDVRVRAQSMAAEALSPLTGRLGVQMQLTVQIYNRNTLAYRVQVGQQVIALPQVVGT